MSPLYLNLATLMCCTDLEVDDVRLAVEGLAFELTARGYLVQHDSLPVSLQPAAHDLLHIYQTWVFEQTYKKELRL